MRKRRAYFERQLAQAEYWIWRLTEFPSMLAESPGLKRMLSTMRQCRITYRHALYDVGGRRARF